jgi:hypothetical protein
VRVCWASARRAVGNNGLFRFVGAQLTVEWGWRLAAGGWRLAVDAVRAHRSWLAPHRVVTNDKLYGRNSAGKYPLDVSESRTAFVLADSVPDLIRNFRAAARGRRAGAISVTRAPSRVV